MRVLALLCFLPVVAYADTQYVTISGAGWHLKFDAPPLTHTEGKARGKIFRYLASSVATGVTVSVSTETEGAQNNAECRNRTWPKTKRNPAPVKGSETLFENATAYFSSYRSEGEYKGKPFKTANAHAYIAHSGVCVDIHVSHWPYAEGSDTIVADIVKSVAVVE